MSLFGAMTTAISGLTAQSKALGNVSENVANSQTVGYKRTDTSFSSYLTVSNQRDNLSGSVVARPDYVNTVQGTVTQTDNTLAAAIAGQGFFAVSRAVDTSNGQTTFDSRDMYTRAGDFSQNSDGYLVNSAGYYLQGWSVNGDGTIDRTNLSPIRIEEGVYNPVASSTITLAANLPTSPTDSTATATSPLTGQAQIYDSLGNSHNVTMSWVKDTSAANTWHLSLTSSDVTGASAASPATLGTYDVTFGTDGTLSSLTLTGSTAGSGVTTTQTAGSPATLSFAADYSGAGTQSLTLDLGRFAQSSGLTQTTGTEYNVRSVSADGSAPGAFSSVSMRDNGDIAINYDNGQSRIIGRVPIVTFADPDKLQRLDGQAFLRSVESGDARVTDNSVNGAGKLVVGSVEGSNVDMASEFSKLIVAQRAYTANTKLVTATDEMLQDTINMRR
ncbi:flagellar hook protein FlgE [Roseomonas sp. NAR14]|uniref:Flagellar hook protein FlgE n=1 Tax=Roseomonas acroporae TaxID=2937791 RepID=A0A9X1YAS5_9PROT|nr:flagellar hook protein FlgE [Roseomonas acroporae]MCK8783046.1 flagellar hook protein FlgE [Roseomonas acroporae]